jgi:hypothetical protein
MKAGVDIFDIASQRSGAIADQECRKVSNVLNTHETVLGRTGAGALQQFVKSLYPPILRAS